MGTIALYVLAALTPAAVFWGATQALERYTMPPQRSRTRRSGPVSTARPLERLTDDLRRLEREYRRIEGSGEPMRARRLQAVRMAYDDTLATCCRAVGVPVVAPPPLSALNRLETEAALAQRGVTW